MSARSLPRPLLGARTSVLSDFEMACALIYNPHFHTVAESLTYAKDDATVMGHRNSNYPKAIVLLLGVLSRTCRSLPGAEAMLRPPEVWQAIRRHWRNARAMGIIGADQPAELPHQPITAPQWRYMVERIKVDPARFDHFSAAFIDAGIALAFELGYFTEGSMSKPALSSSLFSDGTEIRSQCRSYVDVVEDPVTGEQRFAAVDPERGQRVRAWLVEDDRGKWRAVDPETGEILKKMPVDVEALASGKYGPTQAAYNIVPLSVRSEKPNSRVTVGIDMDFKDSEEAKTTLRLIERVMSAGLAGRVQCMITDMILRGVHHVELYKKFGIVPVNKVAAAAPKDESLRDILDSKGKRIKTLPISRETHSRADGAPCHHLLQAHNGTLVEVDWNEDGTTMVATSAPERRQVKRMQETTTAGGHYRVSVRYTVQCRNGDFDFWISPHSESGDDGRKVAENLRVFPEGDPVFKKLYGVSRNTSEGGNAHHKNSLPHKRAQATGRIPVLLDAHLHFISENTKTWYFQVGWKTVDPLLHGATPESIDDEFELAS